MTSKFAILLSIPFLISLSACDKGLSAISSNNANCGDENSLQLVESLLDDSTQSYVKKIASNEGVSMDSAALRASTSQITYSLEDVRTSKTDPNSTKVFCVAALSTSLDAETIDRANLVNEYYGLSEVNEQAFQQDLEMEGNVINYSIEYSIQPTDDGANIYGQLQNGSELIDFISTTVVSALQKNDVQAMKSQEKKDNAQRAIAEKQAIEDEAASIAEAEATASMEAASELANISLEKAKSKATMDYKRSEFNELWSSASTEIRESLAEGQKEWVEERDQICLNRAQESEVAWQEVVRMDCISELLGDRYYQVKEYIDNYS